MAVMLPSAGEKAAAVRAMFDRIADGYDRMNALLTLRLDGGWRRTAVDAARVCAGSVVVDLACGTGDLAALAAARGAAVVGVDFAPRMLAVARRRGVAARFVRADAAALPLADAVADAVTCGFALRNFLAIPPVLREAARVLRRGGRLVLLEVGTPAKPLVRRLHRVYFGRLVPLVGALLADGAAYRYLPASVAYLPPAPTLWGMIEAAGFRDVAVRPLAAGAVQLVVASRGPA
jgi:demethylmenaquinone methyltransferase/2-methoxy-6-polyprenyl-1,4-benzoquinol methylase